MIVPFEPEPIEEARARFPVALETTYEPSRQAATCWNRPGQKRENIFDFDDGLRLMVSRDIMRVGGEPVIHVSASLYEKAGWNRSRKRCERIIRHRLEELMGGGRVVLGTMWVTSGGIPHWTITYEEPSSKV